MTPAVTPRVNFDNSFARLPDVFYRRIQPEPVSAPSLIIFNETLAAELNIDVTLLSSEDLASVFCGNTVPTGADPLAMVYAGHQFGHFSPQLGDGRAVLLGETLDTSGVRYDLQLKGSGRTPYSRSGDGRAWIGPVLREYLVSEALHSLGVPGTRALAAVATGDSVYREQVYPGAVLTRVSRSLVRVGTFQYFASIKDYTSLKQLADYVIERHYPDLTKHPTPYQSLLEAVIKQQVALVSHWQSIGFIHGVMNTDNASIIGDTIDFGPCAFMDTFHPATVFSAIDHGGRYAWQNQPAITHWNMVQLAQALLPLFHENAEKAIEDAQAIVDQIPAQFTEQLNRRWREKLGLSDNTEDTNQLVTDFLSLMQDGEADFTLAFRALSAVPAVVEKSAVASQTLVGNGAGVDENFLAQFAHREPALRWLTRWRQLVVQSGVPETTRNSRMQAVNPRFIPRNHQIERLISAAVQGDYTLFHAFHAVLKKPFDEQPDAARFSLPPEPTERVTQTFCGT